MTSYKIIECAKICNDLQYFLQFLLILGTIWYDHNTPMDLVAWYGQICKKLNVPKMSKD